MLSARKYLTRSKPEVLDVSLVTKDTISLTSSSSGDSEDIEVVCSDVTIKTGAAKFKGEYKDRLYALLNKANKTSKTSKLKPVYDHKVSDVSPKRNPNDVIWNAYATTKSFKAIIHGVIKTQAVVRRWLVLKEKKNADMALHDMAIRVQRAWRRVRCRVVYLRFIRGVTQCQSLTRIYLAACEAAEAESAEKLCIEEDMCTKIAAAWKGYRCQVMYKSIVTAVILLQSTARRYAAQKKVEDIAFQKDVAAATVIQAQWRNALEAKHYATTQRSTVTIQCFARRVLAFVQFNQLKEDWRLLKEDAATKMSSEWKRFRCQAAFKRTVKCIIAAQSIARRFLAIKTLERIKYERVEKAATRIESKVRGFVARKHFMNAQSLAREHSRLHMMWQRQLMEEKHASKIAAVWKGFRVRSGYIVVLLAARRHVRRSAAASVIQRNWKTMAAMRSYRKTISSVTSLQCATRVMIAVSRVNDLRHKLTKASNYHSDDCFTYSKQRTASSIKIQSIYRMHILRKPFVSQKEQTEEKAKLLKTQTAHLLRYVNRMNQVTGNDEANNDDSGVEVDLEQHKIVCPLLDHKKQGRQAAKEAYLEKYDYDASKQRQMAATLIQKSYREHLQRNSGCAIMDSSIEVLAAQMFDFSCSWFQQ